MPRHRERRGIPLRAVVPNAVTALALCSGLTGVRYAIAGDWKEAATFVLIAAVLDGLDGQIARMLKGQSRFGAELDSLADVIAFGVSPALLIYLWTLHDWRLGWFFSLAYAVCAALRLARFNASIDVEEQPHKSAGFLTGVPAPAGAALLLLPVFVTIAAPEAEYWLRNSFLIAGWTAICALLMVSSVATYSWGSMRIRRSMRFTAMVVIALAAGALVSAPWETLSALALLYLVSIPFSFLSYRRVRALRGGAGRRPEPASPEA
jgi:CDP-diacylglycerol--serine O-phosphatidyltransferase